ncbi:MAG: ATP-binding protein [Chthoniobacteraceae bacterium]
MSLLSKITKGAAGLPPRVLLSGPEGIGKSTFAANAPAPLFLAAEDGLTGLERVDRYTPGTFRELLDFITEIEKAPKVAFRTLVIDTADWLERLIQDHCCKRDHQKHIESYSFGKGYKIVEPELVALLAQLDRLRHKHRLGIIILSHVQIKSHTPPGGDPYDRYEMKGHKGFTGLLREWPDACLFAVFETFTTKEGNAKKTIGGERTLHTQWAPGWDAKNRYNLPDPIPLDRERGYSALLELIAQSRTAPAPAPEELREKIRTLAPLAQFPDEAARNRFTGWMADLETHSTDMLKKGLKQLEQLLN